MFGAAARCDGDQGQIWAVIDEMVLALANAPRKRPLYVYRILPPTACVIYSGGRSYPELEFDNGPKRNQRGCTKIPSCDGRAL